MDAETAARLAAAHLTEREGEPCATFAWSARETRTHWRFYWNTVAAMEGRAPARKGVAPVAVDKRSGHVALDLPSSEGRAPRNASFPPRDPAHDPSTEAGARAIAQGWLDATSEIDCSIIDARERAAAWVFVFTSDEWLRTRDVRHALAGNGPLVVLKASGDLYALGTAKSIDDEIAAFEAWLSSRA
jgi:hypothetical protein